MGRPPDSLGRSTSLECCATFATHSAGRGFRPSDSRQVRITARRATVGFFVRHLQNGPALETPSTDHARVRVAREFPTARRNGGPPFKPAKS